MVIFSFAGSRELGGAAMMAAEGAESGSGTVDSGHS